MPPPAILQVTALWLLLLAALLNDFSRPHRPAEPRRGQAEPDAPACPLCGLSFEPFDPERICRCWEIWSWP